jgi:hypothetical protein
MWIVQRCIKRCMIMQVTYILFNSNLCIAATLGSLNGYLDSSRFQQSSSGQNVITRTAAAQPE